MSKVAEPHLLMSEHCAAGPNRLLVVVVSAGAAALDKRVAETAANADISGLEFFFGIPGTIGGALRMNAGANGAETRDVLIEAVGIGRDGEKHTFSNADMKFVYRNSGVDPSIIFTSARVSPNARGDNRITTPGMPPSRTIRLEPTPTT